MPLLLGRRGPLRIHNTTQSHAAGASTRHAAARPRRPREARQLRHDPQHPDLVRQEVVPVAQRRRDGRATAVRPRAPSKTLLLLLLLLHAPLQPVLHQQRRQHHRPEAVWEQLVALG